MPRQTAPKASSYRKPKSGGLTLPVQYDAASVVTAALVPFMPPFLYNPMPARKSFSLDVFAVRLSVFPWAHADRPGD